MRSRPRLMPLALGGLLLVSGAVVVWGWLRRAGLPPAAAGEELVTMTGEDFRRLSKELAAGTKALTPTASREEYRRVLPRLCETSSFLWGLHTGEKFYDWALALNPAYCREPVLDVLRGPDTTGLPAAAFLTGLLDIREATPVLIGLLTTRFHGRLKTRSDTQQVFVQVNHALGRLAAAGDRQAAEFLLSHVTTASWQNPGYTIWDFDQATTAEYLLAWNMRGLVHHPCAATVKALETESDYRPEIRADHLGLVKAYLASGDSLAAYHREIWLHGFIANKYYSLPPGPLAAPRTRDVVAPGAAEEPLSSGTRVVLAVVGGLVAATVMIALWRRYRGRMKT